MPWTSPASAGGSGVRVEKGGTVVGTRGGINLIEGSNVTLTVSDDSDNDEVDVTIAAAGGGGSAPEDPETVDGLVLWVDPSHVPSSDGTTVRGLTDRSAYGIAAVGSTGVYKDAIFGTEPAIRFAGGGGYTSRLTTPIKPFTAFSVINIDSLSTNRTIFGSSPANSGLQWRVSSSGKLELLHQDVAILAAGTTTLTTGTDYLVAVTYSSAGAWTLRVNGASDGSGTNNASPAAGILVVAGRAGAEQFSGDSGALLVYDNVLASADIDTVEAYLAARYGITI